MNSLEDIDASQFEDASLFYEMEFVFILNKIYLFCEDIIKKGKYLENNEDKVRDFIYLNYLSNPAIKTKYDLYYHFECEPKEFGSTEGYLDIKICNENIFHNPNEYYIIECKRLDN